MEKQDFRQLVKRAERVRAKVRATREEHQAVLDMVIATQSAAYESRALFGLNELRMISGRRALP